MNIPGQKKLGRWPSFEFDGVKLKAEVHTYRPNPETRPDQQRRTVYLARRKEQREIERDPDSRHVTRLSYMAYEGQPQRALFIGMSVSTAMRRAGIGKQLFSYFMENIREEDNISFAGTGKLHKPVLALIAKEAGLVPKSTNCMAEVLPHGLAFRPEVPLIRFLKQDLPPSEMKDSSVHNLFYEVAPPEVLDRPVNLARVVALHTGYLPPQQESISAPAQPVYIDTLLRNSM